MRFSCSRLSRPGARSTAVTFAPAATSCAVLPPGAAHRSATRKPATLPRSRAGIEAAASCTHHAPSSKPGSAVTAPCTMVRTEPVGSTRPSSFAAQVRGIRFHRQIERRLAAIGGGNGVRGRLAVGLDPARHQPWRRIEHRRIERRDPLLAFARDPPQHRVDQAGKVQRHAILARQPHREIDRGMVGHFEKQNLRRADQERGLDPRRLRRQPLLEKRPKQMAQGAEPAQHDGNDRPRQPAVAIGERRKRRGRGARIGAFEHLVERPVPIEHALDDIGRDPPHRQTGRVVALAGARLLLARIFRQKFLLAGGPRLRQVRGDANRPAITKPSGARTRGPSEREAPAVAGSRTRACRSGSPPRRTRPQAADQAKESGGRGGLDPTRYGDWEKDGLISDF